MSTASTPRRGTLRVYLGAAPGVGKTYAMLEEGRRRAARGTNVVVGIVETHGRAAIHGLLADLTVIPPRSVLLAGISVPERDRLRRSTLRGCTNQPYKATFQRCVA